MSSHVNCKRRFARRGTATKLLCPIHVLAQPSPLGVSRTREALAKAFDLSFKLSLQEPNVIYDPLRGRDRLCVKQPHLKAQRPAKMSRELRAQDEALARMRRMEQERGSHRQTQARTSATPDDFESHPPSVTRVRLTAQEQRDLELARQFEAFGVFAGSSQSRDKSSSSSSLPLHQIDLPIHQQGRDITVSSGARIQVKMQPSEPTSVRTSAGALSDLQGMESSFTREHGPRVSRHNERRMNSNSGFGSSWPQVQDSTASDGYRNPPFNDTANDGPWSQVKSPPTNSQTTASVTPRVSESLPIPASGAEDPFAYARQLQEQAFKSLQQHDLTRDDMELARKMQELEDSGLGRLNSSRKLSDDDDNNGEDGFSEDSGEEGDRPGLGPFFAGKGSMMRKSSQQDEDEKLARYMQGGGTSIRNLSRHAVTQLLGQGSADLSRENATASTAASPSISNQQTSMFPTAGPTSTAVGAQPLPGDVFWGLEEVKRRPRRHPNLYPPHDNRRILLLQYLLLFLPHQEDHRTLRDDSP
jgi:hypothetical protein